MPEVEFCLKQKILLREFELILNIINFETKFAETVLHVSSNCTEHALFQLPAFATADLA
jgi:hypothetical protein